MIDVPKMSLLFLLSLPLLLTVLQLDVGCVQFNVGVWRHAFVPYLATHRPWSKDTNIMSGRLSQGTQTPKQL